MENRLDSSIRPCVLTVAGLDPSAGAGIFLDIRVFDHLGVHGLGVCSLLTSQGRGHGVEASLSVSDIFFSEQLKLLFSSFKIDAVKVGAVASWRHWEILFELLEDKPEIPVVVDPVIFSKTGLPLTHGLEQPEHRKRIFRRSTLLTPNTRELEMLGGKVVAAVTDVFDTAANLFQEGIKAIFVKGGHLPASGDLVSDWLLLANGQRRELAQLRQAGIPPRGTGCALASAITAYLAHGKTVDEAVQCAQTFVALARKRSFSLTENQQILQFDFPLK